MSSVKYLRLVGIGNLSLSSGKHTGTRHQLIGWPVLSTERVKMMKRLYNDVSRDIVHNGGAYFSNNGPRFTPDASFTLIYRIRGNISLEKSHFHHPSHR